MDYLREFAEHLWLIGLETAPWLLLGLVVAGAIKVWMPQQFFCRWLGGRGITPIFNAAILGTPLPLCSCSVVPAALALRRGGISKGATVSFLVATPENGADSIALSYALLGLFMAIVRPIAAVISALFAGILTAVWDRQTDRPAHEQKIGQTDVPCCSANGGDCESDQSDTTSTGIYSRVKAIIHFACDDLLRDIWLWLTVGILLAALVNTLVPPNTMASWGSGLPAMLAMLVIGVPMYICATASTPLAASMILAGVSPGTVLVFLLAGPATNLGTIGIVRQELGNRACIAYLFGTCVGAVMLGWLTDQWISLFSISVTAQIADHLEYIPHWLAVTSLAILVILTARIVVQWMRHTIINGVKSTGHNSKVERG